jgi:hypothetical protein
VEKVAGIVGRVNFSTKISSGTGVVRSYDSVSFTVDGRHIEYAGGGNISLGNGDSVVVEGFS